MFAQKTAKKEHLSPISIFKYIYSSCILLFCITIIMGLIATKKTNLSSESSPWVSYLVIWAGVIWLTMIEGTQASLVGLAKVDEEIFENTHPITFRCCHVTSEGDRLERYLLGRQFMVCMIIFLINFSGGPIADVELWGFPTAINHIFFTSGLAMIFFTVMVGQLNSQINASKCMLDYCNNTFAFITMWFALGIEFSGLLHATYLIQMTVVKLSGKEMTTKEQPRTTAQSIFFWFRCLMSLAILCGCFAVTVVAILDKETTMWKGVSSTAALITFFVLICIVGMLEGMQIAFFFATKLEPADVGDSYFAKKTYELLFKEGENNLSNFMDGRQLFVVAGMFLVARVTSLSLEDNTFGVPDGLQAVFSTGILGALILTIIGSITWQIVASTFPQAFLGNPLTYVLLRVCLFVHTIGICSSAWVLAEIYKRTAGLQKDSVYIGTREERKMMRMPDQSIKIRITPGHIIKLPAFAEKTTQSADIQKDIALKH
mmetsp:Transcript_31580/g.36490  ORF Transcript_31580/g.36490 Transcript_31580/m.36490 type:complete len:488 (-) Transcript_31580:305-1768(-)